MDEAPRAAAPPALPIWPRSVQLALGLLLTAGIFFTLGRWSSGPAASSLSIAHQAAGPRLDLNRATKAELRLLPGLGDLLAQRIVDHRAQHGSFQRIDDLGRVSGIGPKTLERLRPWVIVLDDADDDMPASSRAAPVIASAPKASTTASRKAELLAGPINVNEADTAELMKLPGIGGKLSQRIVDERARGAFQSVEELRRVPGIGAKTLEKLRPYVAVK